MNKVPWSASFIVDINKFTDPISILIDNNDRGQNHAIAPSDLGDIVSRRAQVKEAFENLKSEFSRAAQSFGKAIHISIGLVIFASVLAICGAMFFKLNPYGGGAITATGLMALLGITRESLKLARTQTLFEIIPHKYETLVLLCSTNTQLDKILKDMRDELNSLQR